MMNIRSILLMVLVVLCFSSRFVSADDATSYSSSTGADKRYKSTQYKVHNSQSNSISERVSKNL